jgi:sec-independent protein translocase protein TatC
MSERPLFIAPDDDDVPAEDSWDQKRMTIVEHLEDLRKVLIHCLVAWGVGAIIGLVASYWVLQLLTLPLAVASYHPVVLSPVGQVTVYLKVGLITGLALALPVILHRVWWFVSPGLSPSERRFARPMMVSSILLFAVGALLAYGFAYLGMQMLQRFSGATGITYIPVLDNYLTTLAVLIVAFGITFEFPVALVMLSLTGVVSAAKLKRWRKGAVLVIFAVGFAITPGADPVTPLALIIPLLVLYEISILVIKRMGR